MKIILRTSLICVLVVLSGCSIPNNNALYSPPPQTMSNEDLNQFRIDCLHAAEQMDFLKKQMAMIPQYEVQSQRRAVLLLLMQSMEYCPPLPARAVGCVHVREDMTNGSANATICNDDSSRRINPTTNIPIVNRWDPLVDTK